MPDIAIVAAKRTVFGRFLGKLSSLSAVDLACAAGTAVLGGLDRSHIDQVIIGNVLAAGQGMNIARNISLLAGVPLTAAAATFNRFCASGLESINNAALRIMTGNGEVFIAGGVESMSVSGAVVSMVQVYEAGVGSVLPNESMALTSKV